MNNFKYRIYYEDTDAGSIVYYANYLKFYERARTDFLRVNGVSQRKLAIEDKIIFVVRRCEVEYLSPAKLDDEILVNLSLQEMTYTTIKLHQEMMINNKILSTLNVELACIDVNNLKAKKIPQFIKDIFHV